MKKLLYLFLFLGVTHGNLSAMFKTQAQKQAEKQYYDTMKTILYSIQWQADHGKANTPEGKALVEQLEILKKNSPTKK
jgi:hypothetical protein